MRRLQSHNDEGPLKAEDPRPDPKYPLRRRHQSRIRVCDFDMAHAKGFAGACIREEQIRLEDVLNEEELAELRKSPGDDERPLIETLPWICPEDVLNKEELADLRKRQQRKN